MACSGASARTHALENTPPTCGLAFTAAQNLTRLLEDDQPDRDVVQRGSDDGGGVKDLVESEPALGGVRPLECVDDCAECVDEAAQDHQDGRGNTDSLQITQWGDDRQPSQQHVHGRGEDARVIDPYDVQRRRCRRGNPAQHEDPQSTGITPARVMEPLGTESAHRHRAIAARDEHGDHHVIRTPPSLDGGFGSPWSAVIQGGGGQHAHQTHRVQGGDE